MEHLLSGEVAALPRGQGEVSSKPGEWPPNRLNDYWMPQRFRNFLEEFVHLLRRATYERRRVERRSHVLERHTPLLVGREAVQPTSTTMWADRFGTRPAGVGEGGSVRAPSTT